MKRDKLGLDRIIFFSDAVFAIAITLLALDLKPPLGPQPNRMSAVFLELLPEYQSYVISFVVIGLYWISHHHYFRFIRRYDYTLVAINIGLLMCIASLPFATSLLDTYGNHRGVVTFYASCMVVTGLMKTLLWQYAAHDFRLIHRRLSRQRIRRLTRKAMIPPAVFAGSIAIATFDSDLAKMSWGAIALALL
jgi:uncharacterized membrane protein